MTTGRKPKPTHLKLVTGNPGKRRINRSEPRSKRTRPSAPGCLSDKAREVWGQVVATLDEMGVLQSADAIAVEMLCEAVADHRAAGDTIRACAAVARQYADLDVPSDFTLDGRYYRTINQAGGVMWRSHPAVALRSDADRRIRSWCSEFGLTPAARSRITANDAGDSDTVASKYFTA